MNREKMRRLVDLFFPLINMPRMRRYRLERIRAQLRRQDIGTCLLVTPHSIRYATGLRNCAGMSDEWPVIFYPEDARTIYDGRLEPGMVMCVESYTGEVGGHEGVKLEQMVPVTEGGPILLSTFPFEDVLSS